MPAIRSLRLISKGAGQRRTDVRLNGQELVTNMGQMYSLTPCFCRRPGPGPVFFRAHRLRNPPASILPVS